MKAAIIADDLTGASDSGVQLAGCGLSVSLLFRMDAEAALPFDAVVLNTDSRAASPREAYGKAKEAAEFVASLKPGVIFKKLDSTLRGNVGAELDAVCDVFRPDFAIIAPAFPGSGRTTANGCQYVNGVPLLESAAGADPVAPVADSYIPQLLALQSDRKCAVVSLEELAAGAQAVAGRMLRLIDEGVPYLVFDAIADEHLDMAAEAVALSGASVVWAGSAGLSRCLAQRGLFDKAEDFAKQIPGKQDASAPTRGMQSEMPGDGLGSGDGTLGVEACRVIGGASLTGKPVLVAVGSVNGTTRAQLAGLLRDDGFFGIALRPELVVPGGEARTAEIGKAARETIALLEAGRDAVLYTAGDEDAVNLAKRAGHKLGMKDAEIAAAIADALAEAVQQAIAVTKPAGLVMTGGDTAGRICARLDAVRLDLIGEVETGIPIGRLIVGGIAIHVVTKAGGFGTERALADAAKRIKGMGGERSRL